MDCGSVLALIVRRRKNSKTFFEDPDTRFRLSIKKLLLRLNCNKSDSEFGYDADWRRYEHENRYCVRAGG